MAYCNHCGRYIEEGLLCRYCTDAHGAEPREQAIIGEQTPVEPSAPPENPTDVETNGEEAEATPHGAEQPPQGDPGQGEAPFVEEGESTAPQQVADADAACACTGKTETCACTDKTETCGRTARACRRLYAALSTPDTTHAFSGRDIRENRGMAALCYLWVLWFVPFFFARSSRYVGYHLGQGLMLLLVDCIAATFLGIAWMLVGTLAAAAPAFAALGEVALLLSLLLKIFGVVSALRGKARELPLLGNFAVRE